jgi:hypothetical protein
LSDQLLRFEDVVVVNMEDLKRVLITEIEGVKALMRSSDAAASQCQHPSIQMDRLNIDRDKLLGRGGFGIVYEGD